MRDVDHPPLVVEGAKLEVRARGIGDFQDTVDVSINPFPGRIRRTIVRVGRSRDDNLVAR